MDKVDATMAAVNEQRELANEIADTIATPLYTTEIDDVCSFRAYSSSIITDLNFYFKEELKRELEDLEQDELNERLNQADHVPVHQPPTAKRVEESKSMVTPHTHVFIWFLMKTF
jgi:charged multivesicular body protein 4A/B